MSFLDVDQAFKVLNSHGYLKIATTVFFYKPFNSMVWRQGLDTLLATLNPVDDQPCGECLNFCVCGGVACPRCWTSRFHLN